MLAADQPLQRADSLHSIESTASNASLSRKPRTTKLRSRSRSAAPDTRRNPSVVDDANGSLSDELFASYSSMKSRSAGHSPHTPDFSLPPNPQSSSPFVFSTPAQRHPPSAEPTSFQPEPQHPRGRHQMPGPSKIQVSRRPRSVPRRAMGSISSDSSRGPPTPVEFSMSKPTHRDRPRDSLQSGTSSSLYPASTQTSTPMDRALSPQLYFEQMPEVIEVPTLAENESGYRDFDTDDVSLRLRLLVNNSYFLPPAHSKPTIADLSNSDAAKRIAKPVSPGFFDIFRIGKARSKPPTPVPPEPPRLRATSESNTHVNELPYTDPTGTSAAPLSPVDIPARVMVVREKMEDLMIAARQAEQESRVRAERMAELQEQNQDQPERFDGIIDPTDAVDLPPPSSKYPFAIQASAAQGLGVDDSIGAAVLADRLPPPRSPGLWSVTEEDEKWRRLLLTQAVGHSLSNTPDSWASRTPARRPPHTTSMPATTPRSPLSPTPQSSPSPTPQPQLRFDEPILLPEILQKRLLHSPSLSHLSPLPNPLASHMGRKKSAPDIQNALTLSPTLGSSCDPPVRAETPVAPTFPLSPAPRATTTSTAGHGVKQVVNPIYSLSQSNLGDVGDTGFRSSSSSSPNPPSSKSDQTSGPSAQEILSGQHGGEEFRSVQSILAQAAQTAQSTRLMKSARSVRSLRKSVDSEKVSGLQGDEVGVGSGGTLVGPPPSAPVSVEPLVISPRHTLGADSEVGTNSQFEEEDTEEWFGLHDDSASRDSSGPFPRTASMISYLAPPSPTVSAFYDALEGRGDSDSSPPTGPDTEVGASSGPETFATADTRASLYSPPPPRQSTSIPPQPLPPPPRRPPLTNPGLRRPSTLRQEPITIWEPEPSSPPLPSPGGGRRGTGFSLDLPRRPERGELSRAVAEETAGGDVSRMSISFFDNIQSDLNELDESSSSEEESDDDPDGLGEPLEAPVFRNPDTQIISIPGRRSVSSTTTRPARPTLMRLGNNSTPQLGSSTSNPISVNDYPPFDPLSFRGPVEKTPTTPTSKSSFFTSRTPKKQKPQGVSSEDYHGPRARSLEEGAGPSNSILTFLDMESDGAPSSSSHESQETDESTRILDGLVLQHLEKERDTIKRITDNNRAAKSKSKP